MNTAVIRAKAVKDYYLQYLAGKAENQKRIAEVMNLKEYEPVMKPRLLQEDGESSAKDINTMLFETGLDFMAIDSELTAAASAYGQLLNQVQSRLNLVKEKLFVEQERLEDLNMIRSQYEVDHIIPVNKEDFSGNFDCTYGRVFSAYSSQATEVELQVDTVNGNGYAGNQYVYAGQGLQANTLFTGKTDYITDKSNVTFFEYSRLCSTQPEPEAGQITHYDDEPCRCAVVLSGAAPFNTVLVSTELTGLKITEIAVSKDAGKTFENVFTGELALQTQQVKYFDSNYYNNGVICIPAAETVKLVFLSNQYKNEKLVNYKLREETGREDVAYDYVELKNTRRKIVMLNAVKAYYSAYEPTAMVSKTYAIEKAKAISVFASESVPSHFPAKKEYLKYTLNVNGVDYDVVPLNSERSGKKMIVCAADNYRTDASSILIREPIVSAHLTVAFQLPSRYETAYVSNLKLCMRYE